MHEATRSGLSNFCVIFSAEFPNFSILKFSLNYLLLIRTLISSHSVGRVGHKFCVLIKQYTWYHTPHLSIWWIWLGHSEIRPGVGTWRSVKNRCCGSSHCSLLATTLWIPIYLNTPWNQSGIITSTSVPCSLVYKQKLEYVNCNSQTKPTPRTDYE